MHPESIQDELLAALTTQYERDPEQFLTVPKSTLDSSLARGVIAELRNAGDVEEQVRGVVRLTSRGYKTHRDKLLVHA